MADQLPKYDAPPVVETVIGVQFSRLQKFSAPHAGWFWRSKLSDEWDQVSEVPRLDDQFETFDDESKFWSATIPGFKLQSTFESRVQIVRNDSERMIQLQDSRFLLNWQKQAGRYPSYETLFLEFSDLFAKFTKFSEAASLGPIELNQWEVTYVNHVPRGCLWETVADWHRVLPQFYPPDLGIPSEMESRSGDWRFALGEKKGRLYVSVRHARTKATDEEVLAMTLTARGPLLDQSDLAAGLELGHSSIVKSFTSVTSDEAHKFWKKKVI